MSCSVFANGSGFFHKKSGGSGKAFPDVCLSPPPPPAGPVPIPYPNSLQASDLTKGSKSVKIQGAETALEDASYVATSTGDEGGTQGGNVISHKTKGKGYFMLWSFDVKVESKGVDRHGDPMAQNCASTPPPAADIQAQVDKACAEALKPEKPCIRVYDATKDRFDTKKLKKLPHIKNAKCCWQCRKPNPPYTPDHVPPMVIRWYQGGCHKSRADWKADFDDPAKVQPHCKSCSDNQGGGLSSISTGLSQLHEYLAMAAKMGL